MAPAGGDGGAGRPLFVIPLFLSVCLGLSALAAGAQLLPLSVTLFAASMGVRRVFPTSRPT